MALAPLIEEVVGGDLPIGLEAHDGSRVGPGEPPVTIVVRRADVVARMGRLNVADTLSQEVALLTGMGEVGV